MKADIFTTNKYGEYIKDSIFDGEKLAASTVVTEDTSFVNNSFRGFGVAITGSSCYNLSKMDAEKRHEILTHLYSPSGIGFKVGRLSVGSSDYSAEVYTYDDVPNDVSLSHFSIERDKDYIIPIIKEILSINPDLMLFASPWSPPGWMKTGGSIGGGYMRDKYLDVYADYFVKYIKAYEEEGIKTSAVTIQNEPETHQNGQMPACRWHPDTESKFASILRKRFDENNINTKIWLYDHNFLRADRVKWCFDEYPDLRKDCAGVAFHYYHGDISQTTVLRECFPELELHFTEGGPRLYDNYATDWCKWGLMVTKALVHGYASFTGWNLMLDEMGGPNVGPFFCGGLVTRNSQDNALSYSGQYKVFKHFSPFLDNAAISPLKFDRHELSLFAYPKQDRYTEGCVAHTPDGKTVLFLINPSDKKEQLQYYHNNKWWYIEMMPDTLATVIF